MLSRRLIQSVPLTSSLRRTFTSSAVTASSHVHAPSIRDLTPETSKEFKVRQKEFRENLEAARKQKELEESQSDVTSSPSTSSSSTTAASASTSSSLSDSVDARVLDAASTLDSTALDSLSKHRYVLGAARDADPDGQASGARRGAFSSLIYGTREGQQMDQDMEKSFSQVLARGKYVHSIVFHEVKPDKVEEYIELVGNWYPKMAAMEENKVHLVGSWRTQVGDNDTFVHIWEYQRYTGYHESLHAIQQHPEFSDFDHKLKSLIVTKRTSLMQEFSFWPTTPPRRLGGLFELRSYTLHPGNLLEWESHWRRGLTARREVMEGVGAWFVQIGELNTVHHLWQFADLEERKVRREESWSVEGWADTVHKTVPLIQTMKSRILIPMPWSPVG